MHVCCLYDASQTNLLQGKFAGQGEATGSLEAPVSLRSLRELLRTKTARHRSWPLSLFYFA